MLVLQESLTNILSSQRRLHARLSASGKRLRVIVVTPGYGNIHNHCSEFTINPSSAVVVMRFLFHFVIRFTDVADVVQAIWTHPDPEVAKCLRIGAVTCCIDPLNTFMENRCSYNRTLKPADRIAKDSPLQLGNIRSFSVRLSTICNLINKTAFTFSSFLVFPWLDQKCSRMLQKHSILIVEQADGNKNCQYFGALSSNVCLGQ